MTVTLNFMKFSVFSHSTSVIRSAIAFFILLFSITAFAAELTGFPATESSENATWAAHSSHNTSKKEATVYTITIHAGDFDREQTIVSFHFPDVVAPGHYRMSGPDGAGIPLQVEEGQKGWFLLDELPAGSTLSYQLNTSPVVSDAEQEPFPKVTPERDHNTITFHVNNQAVLSYYHKENEPPEELDDRYQRGGYIHPVYSPEGTLLTNHLNPDVHPHHSGIWSAWTNTRFGEATPDFWNVHQNTGRVDIDSMDTYWSGSTHGGFQSYHHFSDLTGDRPVTALNEQWIVRVYQVPDNSDVRIFDLDITQTVNSDQPLILPEYHYGGVGFRGHVDWDDPSNVFFLTSDGLGREGHATRARWSHIGGFSGGDLAGIAILGHPSNYRFPQPMRIHPDEPFFNFAPTQLGNMEIKPGEPYVARYRYVTYDGEPDPDLIDRLWLDYAYPPGVTVRKHK